MAHELVIRNGVIFKGDSEAKNNLTVEGSLINPGTVTVNTNNSPYQIGSTEQFILIDPTQGNVEVIMPKSINYEGRQIFFKLTEDRNTSLVQIKRKDDDEIDGAESYTDLDDKFESILLVSNGSKKWFIF
tara:strand:+ start:5582 stop:5971 length:390 start_codon:yes stop_codon:yes gene_type:complete